MCAWGVVSVSERSPVVLVAGGASPWVGVRSVASVRWVRGGWCQCAGCKRGSVVCAGRARRLPGPEGVAKRQRSVTLLCPGGWEGPGCRQVGAALLAGGDLPWGRGDGGGWCV